MYIHIHINITILVYSINNNKYYNIKLFKNNL